VEKKLLVFFSVMVFLFDVSAQSLEKKSGPSVKEVDSKESWMASNLNWDFVSESLSDTNCKQDIKKFIGCFRAIQFLYMASSHPQEVLFSTESFKAELSGKKMTNGSLRNQLFEVKPASILSEEERKTRESLSPYEFQIQRAKEKIELLEKAKSSLINAQNGAVAFDQMILELSKDSKITKDIMAMAMNVYFETAVDPHSYLRLVTEDMLENSKAEESFVGIGIHFYLIANSYPIIQRVLREGPAAKAGLQIDDEILAIDGESTLNLKLTKLMKLLAGPKGSLVRLKIKRGSSEVEFNLVRNEVVTKDVEDIATLDVNELKLGYVAYRAFKNNNCQELLSILGNYQNSMIHAGVILDLRGNPGGSVVTASCILGGFLGPNLPVVYLNSQTENLLSPKQLTSFKQVEPEGKSSWFLTPPKSMRVFAKSLVIMIDQHSASSAELVASALRDYNVAILVGNRSFGKATMQGVYAVSQETSSNSMASENKFIGQIRLMRTMGVFYSPKGLTHQGSGVTPHYQSYFAENPSMGEMISSREEDLFLFPLSAPQQIVPPFISFKALSYMDRIELKNDCVKREELLKVYREIPKSSLLRDLQLLTALKAFECHYKGQ